MKGGPGYYSQKLAGRRLQRCYDIAPLRVQQYLKAEIEFVRSKIHPQDRVLELGCGYGRVLKRLIPAARSTIGIDTSRESLDLAVEYLGNFSAVKLLQLEATQLAFADSSFDLVICVQNGISAFHVDRLKLLAESWRVTRSGGRILFSSYASEFWGDRLDWFRRQAAEGLVGEIDEAATGDGVIVCRDGFTATTISANEFRALCSRWDRAPVFHLVDDSSLFCEIVK